MKKTTIYLVVIIFATALFSCNGEGENTNNNQEEDTLTETIVEEIEIVEEATFTDNRDQHVYKTVKIGEQVWFAENLAFIASSGCWSYDEQLSNVELYGYLYTWKAATKSCPDGWHLPTDDEWKELEMHLGLSQTEADETGLRGIIAKQLRTQEGWFEGKNGTNETGLSIVPNGFRKLDGSFLEQDKAAYFWTASSQDKIPAWQRNFGYNYRGGVFRFYSNKLLGFSVRCVKN